MKTKHTIILAVAGLLAAYLAPVARAAISFNITNTSAGNSQWQLIGSDTTFTVGTFNPTGNYGEQILLPKVAFAFDYSQDFFISFNSSIGSITDLTSGQSVPLNQIFYSKHLDELQITGGVMNHSLGDQFQITNFATSSIAVPFSDLTATNSTGYSQPGAWHDDSQINITPISAPEPSSVVLLGISIAFLWFCRNRRPVRNPRNKSA